MEGNGGQTNLEFRIILDRASAKAVDVTYSTVEAAAKGGQDFIAETNQTVTIQPGQTETKIIIMIAADDIKESEELFNVVISGVTNDEFHVFSIEWKQDQIKWFVHGNLFSTVNKADVCANWPFNEDFYLIFNLAVGGNWPGNPDASTYFPQWLIVDYIRVYQ